MRHLLKKMLSSLCLLITVLIVFTSVSIAPAIAQAGNTDAKSPPKPASIDASAGTNVKTIEQSRPSKNEAEFKTSPHVYDMQSIREFDRQLYQGTEARSPAPSDRS